MIATRCGFEGTDQLELDLFPSEPWSGKNPRALTRVGLGLIFKPQGVRARVIFFDSDQLELFPRRRERLKQKSRMAPTLLPLPFPEDTMYASLKRIPIPPEPTPAD